MVGKSLIIFKNNYFSISYVNLYSGNSRHFFLDRQLLKEWKNECTLFSKTNVAQILFELQLSIFINNVSYFQDHSTIAKMQVYIYQAM